jgi:RHS repeat-associated protein
LGSASLETNETGQVISYEEYHPFGTSAYRVAKSGTDLSLKRYRFTNKERDDETGLYYFGVRYYAAWLGRWTSSDPGGFVDGLNLYQYAQNNPVKLVDEKGYNAVEPENRNNGGQPILDDLVDRGQGDGAKLDYLVNRGQFDGVENGFVLLGNDSNKSDDWIEKDGKMMYDNRVTNQEEATDFYGEGAIYRANGYEYTSSDGNSIELGDYGFFKSNGSIFSAPDLAQNSLSYTNPELARKLAELEINKVQSNYAIPMVITGGISTDALFPDPSDAAWPKWLAYAVVGSAAAYYIAKRDKEIAGIRKKSGGPKGVQYSLRATGSGAYLCYRCGSGTMNLKIGNVWKYGETTKNDRYRQTKLNNWGVEQVDEFHGNRVQIKVMEKVKIYGYFLLNGHLPPGNKIFR